MSPNLTAVLAAAESLPVPERRELIELLLLGLEDSAQVEAEGQTPVLSEAWHQEIARRSAEFDAGREETVSWEEIQTRWKQRRASGG
jgi:putative addiction module component (TIGR02574 family)